MLSKTPMDLISLIKLIASVSKYKENTQQNPLKCIYTDRALAIAYLNPPCMTL